LGEPLAPMLVPWLKNQNSFELFINITSIPCLD